MKIGQSTVPALLVLRSTDGRKLAASREEIGGLQVMPALILGPEKSLETEECMRKLEHEASEMPQNLSVEVSIIQ